MSKREAQILQTLLALFGGAILVFAGVMVAVGTTSSKTTALEPISTAAKTTTSATTQTATATTTSSTTTSSTTTTPATPAAQTLKIENTDESGASENELIAMLGLGVGLVLAAAFFRRLTTLKLPGGIELDLEPLSPTPQEKKALADAVAEQVRTRAPDPAAVGDHVATAEFASLLTAAALAKLREAKLTRLSSEVPVAPRLIVRPSRLARQQPMMLATVDELASSLELTQEEIRTMVDDAAGEI